MLRNLLEAGFDGDVRAVNRRGYEEVHGVPCVSRVSRLPRSIELALICTRPRSIPRLVGLLGAAGVKAAAVLMGGLTATRSWLGQPLKYAVQAAARPHGIRILGPNSLGVLVPGRGLNASYAHVFPETGSTAFVGESPTLGAATLDWAKREGLGFSHFLTVGDAVDVDSADLLDYLAGDYRTRSIVLHVDRLENGARFLSALRVAARAKRVVVLKSGGSDPAEPRTPGLEDRERLMDAVIRRAGALRVTGSDQLFETLDALGRMREWRGGRVAVLCNGIGAGRLAADALRESRASLAALAPDTVQRLKPVVSRFWDGGNPVDLNADAFPQRYAEAMKAIASDPEVDGLLALHVPTLAAPSGDCARIVAETARELPTSLLAAWLGRHTAQDGRRLLRAAGIPTYATPEQAVAALDQVLRYRESQEALRETPPAVSDLQPEALDKARGIIDAARSEGTRYLSRAHTDRLLNCIGIESPRSRYPDTPAACARAYPELGGPVSLRLLHEQYQQPFSLARGGRDRWHYLAVDINSAAVAEQAALRLEQRFRQMGHEDSHLGFVLQRLDLHPNFLITSAGISRDPVFGPVIWFGLGGLQLIRTGDRQVALPPLNLALAREVIRRSAVHRVLSTQSRRPGTHLDGCAVALVRLSELVLACPHLAALEINALVLGPHGILALDSAAELGDAAEPVLRPYPVGLCERLALPGSGEAVVLRPVRAEDEPAHQRFYERLSPQTLRFRFFHVRRSFSHADLAQMTQIDYDREMAFIATSDGRSEDTLGEARVWIDSDNLRGEFSVVVAEEMRGTGLGYLLLDKLVRYCRDRGTLQLYGTVLPDNAPMRRLAERMGFEQRYLSDDDVVAVSLALGEPDSDWQRRRMAQP